jgi:hypothetical protein
VRRWHRILPLGAVLPLGVGAALAFALAGQQSAVPARASRASSQPAEQSILQDDDQLLYSPPAHVVRTLHQLKGLGVDVVKVSMVWWIIAPDANSTHKPTFDATNPAAYPPGGWARYDLLAQETHKLGMRLFLQFAPKNPAWAAQRNQPRGQGNPLGLVPNFKYFEQFVEAVGRRYNGHAKDAQGKPIPPVSYWGIWNEPNWSGWLNPWHRKVHGKRQLTQPLFYRSMVNAAWKGLSASGHGHDTILIGETANVGSVHPLPFVEDLYCVGRHYKPLSGRAAQAVGCPAKANRSKFMARNPGLFHITGYSHHPYGFDIPPNKPKPDKSEVTLFNIGELEKVLNGIFGGYHQGSGGGIPLYLTEWGYVTNPPNPAYRTTLSEQAAWLDEGEYMTWREPYIKALAQFLLVDVKPYWPHPTLTQWRGVFDSGLELPNGQPKPALKAYRLPIWLPSAHPGRKVTLWGQLRPADHSGIQHGVIEFLRQGTSKWKRLQRVQTGSSEGFLLTHVSIGHPGLVRLGWVSPTHTWYYSRSVTVS